jgi:membrane protein DedA with SNARE-associated domain
MPLPCFHRLGHSLFRKHGGKVVFFGRFIAVLRAWAAFLAGTNRMSRAPFLLYNALGYHLLVSVLYLDRNISNQLRADIIEDQVALSDNLV